MKLLLAFALALASCTSIAPSAPPAPLAPTPSPRQRAWSELEFYAFVHFNMDTFTDREWGLGTEDPNTFAPSALDCRQWARVAKSAGMKGIVITAKHHDGLCLWPTKVTKHSVASSAWREGKGDVLRELSDACREFGLKFGVYLSPWDRNNPHYGDSQRYNDDFVAQLEEVLSSYGPIFEVWFDGACGEGPNGKRQVYDWPRFVATVRRLQPDAVIFSDVGPDIRWIGNEQGIAGETCWSMISPEGFEPGAKAPSTDVLNAGLENGTHWIQGECDVSIRPGWYYHASQDGQVKSLERLLEIWHGSVGRNANLLLNLPVDRHGLVHESDAARLGELRSALDAIYRGDVARRATVSASNVRADDARFAAANAIDGDPRSYWATDDGVRSATLALKFDAPTLVDRVALGEAIELGQRIKSFAVEARTRDGIERLAAGTTLGRKRILEFAPREVSELVLRIEDSRASPTVAFFEAYCAPPTVEAGATQHVFLESTMVTLTANQPGCEIHYTLDGSLPTRNSTRYEAPFVVTSTSTVVACACRGELESVVPTRLELQHETLRPATQFLRAPDTGLRVRCYEGGWQSLVDLGGNAPVREGIVDAIDLAPRTRDELFALVFEGWTQVPSDGLYTVGATSDDGSRVYVDGVLVVDNDGLHGESLKLGTIGLAAGFHSLRVEYFNAGGGLYLDVDLRGPGAGALPAPLALFH